MEIPFVTLKKYDGLVLPRPNGGTASIGGDQGMRWIPTGDAPSWAAGATEEIFKQRGDRLQQVYKLEYGDINGLGNSIYRLDGRSLQFCLKVLGDSEGNERETRVWEALGYGMGQGDKPFTQIKGLPPAKFTFLDRQLRTVLTPFYPGVLKAVTGGSYELPLVICAALYVEESLAALHERGLAYMDLCPSNILFKTTPNGTMLFFLTDMGGVKPLVGADHDDLLEVVVARRWTRREVLPPTHLFAPHERDPRLEPNPAYDYYTLARTCQVLLGLGPDADANINLQANLSLEDPMQPTQAEMEGFLGLIQPWLSGQVMSGEARSALRLSLKDLFRRFFLVRHQFALDYLGDSQPGKRWGEVLVHRLERYRMALESTEFEELKSTLQERREGASPFCQDTAEMGLMVKAILSGEQDTGLAGLQRLGQSELVKVSRVANYALFHHKQLLRGMFAGSALRQGLASVGADLPRHQPMAEEPEAATSKAVRRADGALDLGILKRMV